MGSQMSGRRSLTTCSGSSSSRPPESCCDLVPSSSLGALSSAATFSLNTGSCGDPPLYPARDPALRAQL